MKIKNKEITINEAIDYANINNILLYRRGNGMLLSDYQINVLNNNGINYNQYSNIKTMLFDIEDILTDNYDEELDLVSSQLAEYIYYNNTNK